MWGFFRELELWRKLLLVGIFVVFGLCLGLHARAQDDGLESPIKRSYHLDRSGSGSSNLCDTSIGCPTLGIWFQQAVGATLTPDIGAAYVMTVNGNPTRVASGVYPSGFASPGYSWRFDGTGDFLSLADDPAFEVADFSVFMCFTPRAGFTTNDVLIAKYDPTGNNRSWRVSSTNGTSVSLLISDDGTTGAGHYTVNTKSAAVSPGRLSCFTVTYDYTTDGNSLSNVWVDGLAVQNSAVMDGPPSPGIAAFTVGADATAAGDIPADIYVAAYYPGVLTAADHDKLRRRFRGVYDSSLSTYVSFTSATPPSLQVAGPNDGVTPYWIDMPANSGQLGQSGACQGIYGASATTNLVQYGSFETWAAGSPTGWTEVPTSTGDATQDTIYAAHGSSALQLNNADADDEITVKGACMVVTGGADYNLSWMDMLVSGTGSLDVVVYEDDSADCGSPTGHTLVGVVPILATRIERETPYTMQAGTIRAQLWFTLPAGAAQVSVVDRAQLKPGPLNTDAYCDAPTAAPATCTAVIPSHPSALSANGSQTIEGTWCTPWAGTDLAAVTYPLFSDGAPATANTIYYRMETATDEPSFYVVDAASAAKAISPNSANWAASTPYQLRSWFGGDGQLGMTWPVGSWGAVTAGAGSGIRAAAQATTYLCATSTAGTDSWINSLTYYRGQMRP